MTLREMIARKEEIEKFLAFLNDIGFLIDTYDDNTRNAIIAIKNKWENALVELTTLINNNMEKEI